MNKLILTIFVSIVLQSLVTNAAESFANIPQHSVEKRQFDMGMGGNKYVIFKIQKF